MPALLEFTSIRNTVEVRDTATDIHVSIELFAPPKHPTCGGRIFGPHHLFKTFAESAHRPKVVGRIHDLHITEVDNANDLATCHVIEHMFRSDVAVADYRAESASPRSILMYSVFNPSSLRSSQARVKRP